MFYVANGKIYSTVRDEATGGFPEFVVTFDSEGAKTLVKTKNVLKEKPSQRAVCTMEELFAQFEGTVIPTSTPEPKKTSKKQ